MDLLRAVKGMDDLYETDLVLWRYIESVARETFLAYGFGEIRTPILEDSALFVRAVGAATDVVAKEMFSFEDKGGRDHSGKAVCLRPENTAGVVRALLEAGKLAADSFQQVFYVGPMFRREQPQAGRRRQFHQIGCEAFGYAEPAMDIAVIAAIQTVLQRLGLASATKLSINTLGDAEERVKYTAALTQYLAQHQDQLSEDSKRRLLHNPLRILDSKDARDQQIVVAGPKPMEFLSAAARAHFDEVTAGLNRLGIPFVVDPMLVRGLDYYTRTVFEFIGAAGLGAQSTVCAGGRYDGLVESLGGRSTPAVGFAGGIERLVLMVKALGAAPALEGPELFLVSADESGRSECERLAFELRHRGIRVLVDVRGRPERAQRKSADKSGARFSALIAASDIAGRTVTVKTMATGDVCEVALDATSLALVVRRF